MSLPPFTFDVLCYLNRDQLDRSSIVCRPFKNYIDHYFHSKPYRVFDQLWICGEMYALKHNVQSILVQWHPNRDNYSVQQFFAGQKCRIDIPFHGHVYYSFDVMRPYFGPTVQIKKTYICVAGYSTCNSEHIAEIESIAYMWRDGDIEILDSLYDARVSAEDFKPILDSPTILQCKELSVINGHILFKDYNVLYAVKVFEICYYDKKEEIDPNSWSQFLEQPGVKPVVVFWGFRRENFHNLLDLLSKDFSSAVSPNSFKIVFARCEDLLTEFREKNSTSGEILQLKKGLPAEYQKVYTLEVYTLERWSI